MCDGLPTEIYSNTPHSGPTRIKQTPHSLSLFNTPPPLNKTPMVLGLTYDTHMTFTPHVSNITNKSLHKLNAMRSLTGTTFGQQKETLCIVYKQYIRTILNYVSTAWYPTISETNLKKLEIVQSKALRIITGCLPSTPHTTY